ncbi:GGDEF domain-containing protein [Defluviitalea saccharophila]|uniref:GGDEF domain-containing protein n=1 Tax=Defluviitalea saccharophila TaxID=879970 RepID=A0ABZ2Y7B4_9FIRM|nr:GGDEF domain-containing protein [Candidatus Epulonipiscium sp.]
MNDILSYKILQQIEAYEEIFDIVRIVEPITKKIIKYKDGKIIEDSILCYSGVLDNKECSNCIGLETLTNQKTLMKIQHVGDKMLLVFTSLIKGSNGNLVLELIKDITEGLVIETVYRSQEHELQNIVQDLNTLIMKDPLTNLYNRRYMDRMLPHEISKCNAKHPLSIAMLDIDHFKTINDTYGHNVGDIAIKTVGAILLNSIRNETDWAARYGGEEFLICLPNTNNEKAYKALERIRKTIEKTVIRFEDKKINITASFGLSTIDSNEFAVNDLFKYVDNKLYQAKEQGRNRVIK